jgi:hypothetical protein
MTQKQRSPRKAGNGHKLLGWVRCSSSLLDVVIPLAFLVLLAVAWIWQGMQP